MDRQGEAKRATNTQGSRRGPRRKPRAARVLGLLLCGLALTLVPSAAHLAPILRTPAEITQSLAQGPHAGECERCHTIHAGNQVPQPYALVGPDDNVLCDNCHAQAWKGGSYGGTLTYTVSAHGSSANMVWPGPTPPARMEAGAAGKCVNCHEPHGTADNQGTVPGLMNLREEATCLACHSGAPATNDVAGQFRKAFRHPTLDSSGRHKGPLEDQPSDFGTTPLNQRHAECEDCHNPHVGRSDPLLPDPTRASNTILGVSRVVPLNGFAGQPPAYTFVPGSDTTTGPNAEYPLCLKCHSGWTTQPSGQTDLGLALNTANPSYHPVEDMGTDPRIALGSFVAGWTATSRTRCDDCHGDDLDPNAGPHGSNYRYLLKRSYTASSDTRLMSPTEQCFSCHAYDVYANPASAGPTRLASRFNQPGASAGHAEHVGQDGVPCYACHVTHGSTDQPHLIAVGRTPGLLSYTQTPTGGTCTSTCHADARSWTVNYDR